ncbi:MAG: hypothetical protein ACLR8Y_21885 [Alistipes indistinctus]
MEGASFFCACTQSGTPFLELRTISNRVGETVPRLGHRNRHGQPGPRSKPIDP